MLADLLEQRFLASAAHDGLVALAQCGKEARLPPGSRVGFLALGDVGDDDEDTGDGLIETDWIVARERMVWSTRFGPDFPADFEIDDGLPGIEDVAEDTLELRPQARHHLGHGSANLLFDRDAVHFRQRLVDSHDPRASAALCSERQRSALSRF